MSIQEAFDNYKAPLTENKSELREKAMRVFKEAEVLDLLAELQEFVKLSPPDFQISQQIGKIWDADEARYEEDGSMDIVVKWNFTGNDNNRLGWNMFTVTAVPDTETLIFKGEKNERISSFEWRSPEGRGRLEKATVNGFKNHWKVPPGYAEYER